MSRRGAKHTLTSEDRRLWEEVRRSVRPLAATPVHRPADLEMEDPAWPGPEEIVTERAPPRRQPLPVSRTPPPPETLRVRSLDDKTARKLKKGRLTIDARVDLHGMGELQAYHALRRFLDDARRQDWRIVLVITGKGERSGGILRNAVPRWFAEPPLSGLVSAFRRAHLSHGGEGALYVRLRRPRDRKAGRP